MAAQQFFPGDMIEPTAAETLRFGTSANSKEGERAVALSTAISLKRIADALEVANGQRFANIAMSTESPGGSKLAAMIGQAVLAPFRARLAREQGDTKQ